MGCERTRETCQKIAVGANKSTGQLDGESGSVGAFRGFPVSPQRRKQSFMIGAFDAVKGHLLFRLPLYGVAVNNRRSLRDHVT